MHVRKVKPGRKTKLCLTPPVKDAIKQRNHLRRMAETHRREWIDQFNFVKEEIDKEKEEKWREVVEDAIESEYDRKIWSFVKVGAPKLQPPLVKF